MIFCSLSNFTLADENDELAMDIVSIQENFLSAITPRPTEDDLVKHSLYPQLVRRISLVIKNWEHQQKGIEDAKKNKFSIIVPPQQSDVEKKYLALLKKEFSIVPIDIPKNLDQEAAIFYTHGYNNHQLKVLKGKPVKANLMSLIQKASNELGYESTTVTSDLFVPWRFSSKFEPSIVGGKGMK